MRIYLKTLKLNILLLIVYQIENVEMYISDISGDSEIIEDHLNFPQIINFGTIQFGYSSVA